MDKLKMHSNNITNQNIDKIAELFPNCITESKDKKGKLTKAIDFDLLKQELSSTIVEGQTERYQLNWPGKREALLTANAPIAKTLRPCREESVNFDTTENLFIEGDNLDALKLLQETYLGKVKMIYIDPPYNTGKDFIYSDNFTQNTDEYLKESNQVDVEGNRLITNADSNGRFHSDWLSMMYSRLKLARNLLKDDGVIFISIDEGEQDNLKKICSEIFGEENYVTNIIWEKKYSPQNDAKYFTINHDFILCICKSKELWNRILLPRSEKQNKMYKNPDNDPRGLWKSDNLSAARLTEKDVYPIENPAGKQCYPPKGYSWRFSKEKMKELITDNRIWFGKDGTNVPSYKRFITEVQNGVVPMTIFPYKEVGHTQDGAKQLKQIFSGASLFSYPKPTSLLKRLIHLSVGNTNELILDFFAGSSSTAHAIIEQNASDGGNRKFIMVQLPEECDEKSEAYKAGYKNIAEISKERIRLAGKQIIDGECNESWNKDIGFRVLKVDTSNMEDVYYNPDNIGQGELLGLSENIKSDRTEEDLLFQVLLDWGVDLTLPITYEDISGKRVYFVDDNALCACFDKSGGITESFVKELANREPLRVVFRDSGFKSDDIKINVEQIFKQMSPHTEVKTI